MKNSDQSLPGLYIHVPFCKSKCPYCDFYSITSLSLIPAWLSGIKKEVLIYKDRFGYFDSLYLGGGTPTIISEPDLIHLVDYLFTHFYFSPDSEISIEANPDDITQEKLKLLRNLGINRISLGAQSFNDYDLLYLSRRHTVLQTRRVIEMIRSAGFTNLGIDLMYGLNGQTETDWCKTLESAVDYKPEHISCYQLTIKKGTPFKQKKFKPLNESKERSLFMSTSALLEQAGYLHYEVSNFAREEKYICRHNAKYWNHTPYLGLGPSAHSFSPNQRWWNVKSLNKYCELLQKNRPPRAGTESLTEEQLQLEYLCLGLRTSAGIDRRFLNNLSALKELTDAKLVSIKGGRVVPTREGFLFADSIPLLLSE
ncbi:MAG: radical SAM family heme chaperone HemW [Thermodesulfobacteriota bacterium]|jgi:oxygen-independent coproporphyrinogen-3 oxidase|nr:MAG: radical SAM family heme chaperone HemW [Thermodesulfobacteriota bacterium]